MKLKATLITIVFVFIVNVLSAQIIEFGGNFSSSNEAFYKNAFGANIGYVQNFKKQYIFLKLTNIYKNNTYSQIADLSVLGPGIYFMKETDGNLRINIIKLGIAQKLLNNEKNCISIGITGSLNYVKFDENIKNFWFDVTRAGSINIEEKTEEFKNRFGYGAFLDMELKEVLCKRLSLFSRVEVEDIDLMGMNRPIGGGPQKTGYTSLEFMLGVRYNLKKE